MHKKIRLIQKGQAGFQFVQQGLVGGLVPTTAGSVLDQNTINAINQQQTNIWKAQQDEQAKIRQQQISQGYQTASNVLNPISSGLTNFGIMSGNYTMANLGQLGGSLSSGFQLMSNWKNLSNQDKTAGVAGIGGQAVDTLDNMFFGKQHAKDSGLTKGLNNAYDSISNAAMMFSPVGCVCAGSRVIDKLGRFVNIEDLTKDDGIIGCGDKLIRPQKIYSFKQPEYKECLRLTLNSGIILECSIDHPILSDFAGRAKQITINGKSKRVRDWQFRRADSLVIGDFVGVVNNIDIWGSEEMWNPYLIGLLIGDGNYNKDHGVRIYSADSETWNYIEKYQLGGQINFDNSNYNKEFRAYRIFDGPEHLRELGIYEQTKKNKRLPIHIHKYTKDSICKLIAGLFDTDGFVFCNIEKKDYKVVFCQSNIDLINQVKEQLLKLGIHSSIQKIKEKTSKYKDHEIKSGISYKLIIKDKQSILNFYNQIHLNLSYKQKNLEEIAQYCQQGRFKDNRELSGAKADKIKKIENIGQQLVYNLQADDDHTYIANGIITHNTIVGGAMKAGKFIGDGLTALGIGTDQMTTTDKILDSSFMKLSPVGLINGIGAKRAKQFSANKDTIEKVGSDYADSVNTIEDAVSKAGKKYGLFSNGARKRANRLIDTARTQQNIMTNISDEYQDQLANKSYLAYTRYGQDINGGIQQQYLRAAKHGAILQRINLRKHRKGGQLKDKIDIEVKQEQWQPIINLEYPEVSKLKEGGQLEESKEWTPIISLDIQKLEEGGKTDKPKQEPEKVEETNQKNVIPEGALHAHKHHMENAEDLTKKGIPVVDNNGEQQAEIERNEIIFSLEVTKQLEDLHKRYQGYTNTQKEKDELAIEAGKLLVYEILHNTEDRTGLIKECKKGGTLDGNK